MTVSLNHSAWHLSLCQAVWERDLSPDKRPGPLVCGETAASCQGNNFLCPIKAKRKRRWKSVQKVEIRTVADQFSSENMTIAQGTGTKWQILFPRAVQSGAKSCCIPASWNISWQVEAAPVSSAASPAQVLSALLPPAARAEEHKPPALTCCYEQHQARFWSQRDQRSCKETFHSSPDFQSQSNSRDPSPASQRLFGLLPRDWGFSALPTATPAFSGQLGDWAYVWAPLRPHTRQWPHIFIPFNPIKEQIPQISFTSSSLQERTSAAKTLEHRSV